MLWYLLLAAGFHFPNILFSINATISILFGYVEVKGLFNQIHESERPISNHKDKKRR